MTGVPLTKKRFSVGLTASTLLCHACTPGDDCRLTYSNNFKVNKCKVNHACWPYISPLTQYSQKRFVTENLVSNIKCHHAQRLTHSLNASEDLRLVKTIQFFED